MAHNPVLFKASKGEIHTSDFLHTLQKAGIKKGDVIFVHADITSFGKLALHDRKELLQALTDALHEIIGKDGTLIMPTFTYSFDKNEVYDAIETRSTVGVLSEHFRNQKGVKRTSHPSHSAAIMGNNKNFFLNIGDGTFDDDSIFGKSYHKNAKLVFFGTPLSKACTFIHFIEQKKGVPYRYHHNYITKTNEKNKMTEKEISFFYKYSYFFTDMTALENSARTNGILQEVAVGDGLIQVVNTHDIFNVCMKELDNDIYFLLKNDSYFRFFNYMMLPIIKYMPWLAKILDRIATFILR